MHLHHRNTVKSAPLFADQMVVLMRADHPLAAGGMTLKKLLSYGHIRVAMSPTDIRFVDSVLASKGMRRNIVATVPHWLLVPRVLASTDLVAVISERAGRTFTGTGTVMRPLPYAAEQFHWTMYWHRRYERSRAHQWLRESLRAAGKSVG
jgi:DNA-binding transcriptional LysR family regulator